MFGSFTGDMPEVINNPRGLYTGNLRHYARAVFKAPNIHHGYHGLRHMLHVTWVSYQACVYYGKCNKMTPFQMRDLLVAALFHDYGHCGRAGDDAANIEKALAGFEANILPCDHKRKAYIRPIIKATQFPHVKLPDHVSLCELVIRDADVSQAFGPAWIGEIAAGFGSELKKTPAEMLKQQLAFLGSLKFHTDFGKVFFGQEAIAAKMAETRALLEILEAK